MTLVTSATVAFGLSMDAFAASLGKGAALDRPSPLEAARIGAWFGGFELMAPVVGLLIGLVFTGLLPIATVEAYDHWIAFALLVAVGARMAWLAYAGGDEDEEEREAPKRHSSFTLAVTAIATSIDATAVGVTLNYMNVNLPLTIALIGLVTFAMSFGGVMIGRMAGPLLGRWAEVAGGFCLIAIGAKILIEHTMA